MEHKFNYRWTLKDANFTKDKGKVFSCFACGGGSTMGYIIDEKNLIAYWTPETKRSPLLENRPRLFYKFEEYKAI